MQNPKESTWTYLIIYQLCDEVEIGVFSRGQRLRIITLYETLIILDITKTESNNCYIVVSHVFASSLIARNTSAITLRNAHLS